MKTNLTEQELNFYNALLRDKDEHEAISSEYYFLNNKNINLMEILNH